MKEVFVHLDRCLGCRSCEIACAVEHSAGKSLISAISEKPGPVRRIYVEMAEGQKMPLVCRHCEDAPCVAVCRTGGMKQDPVTGIVDRIVENCVGCWMCAMVCPYGVIGRHTEVRMAVKPAELYAITVATAAPLVFTDRVQMELNTAKISPKNTKNLI